MQGEIGPDPRRDRRRHGARSQSWPALPEGLPQGLPCHSADEPPPPWRRSCQSGDQRSNRDLESQGGSPPRDHQATAGQTSAISRIGVLWNSDHIDPEYRESQAAGRAEIHSLEVRGPGEFDHAFRTAAAVRVEAIVVVSSRLMSLNRQRVIDLATRNGTPLVTGWGGWPQAGALLSYGPDLDGIVRHAATYVDKILRGAKPGDLPVEQPTKFELMINLKTTKALGLTIPQSLLLRADRVIQ